MPINDLFAGGKQPNLLFIITDQQRSILQWPTGFQSTLLANLPAMQTLMDTGLSFNKAYTNSCMCTPSRGAFLTSKFPAETGVAATGQSVLPLPTYTPQFPDFPDGLPNLATVLKAAGYGCYWIGKWHLFGKGKPATQGYPAIPAEPGQTSADLAPWGFEAWSGANSTQAWDSPDAGISLAIDSTLGGGTPDNDGRYSKDAQAFLASPPQTPFCLVVSFVNPHDVYVGQYGPGTSGYTTADFNKIVAPLPANASGSDLPTKPRAQAGMSWSQVMHTNTQQDYINFYAWLQTQVDENQISEVLGSMSANLLEDTLVIRMADHGEMGLSHSLVEKFYNAYEETIHVPLIFSNPTVYPPGTGTATDALASLIDLAPTLASLLGVSSQFTGLRGQDLSGVLSAPSSAGQDQVHFTYNDDSNGQGPCIIRSIRTSDDWKYSVYFYATDKENNQSGADWEMYDLKNDPSEDNNLAGNPSYANQQTALESRLVQAMTDSYTTPPNITWPPTYVPNDSRGGPPPWYAPPLEPVSERMPSLAPSALSFTTRARAAADSAIEWLGGKLNDPATSDEEAVNAAHALAMIGTAEAFAALFPAIYAARPPEIMARINDAYGGRVRALRQSNPQGVKPPTRKT